MNRFSEWMSGRVFRIVHGNNLVYNTCWEDPRLDKQVLNLGPQDNLLVITSAGCNALSYALTGLNHVYAVDMNPRQNALLELKMAAIKNLDYATFFQMFGNGRLIGVKGIYGAKLRDALSPWTKRYWDKRIRKYFDSKRKSYVGRLPERGRYCFGKITLSTRFPCGFFRSSVELNIENEMIVLPKVGTLATGWMTRQHDASETMLHRRHRPSRVTGEFLGVRGWRHGDTKRWIHWRASARHDQLVVRQYEQHQNHDTAVLLDLFYPEGQAAEYSDGERPCP